MPESKSSDPSKTIQFVCQHGAFRCRIAAAYFDALAPEGWSATTGGVTPQEEVSDRLGPTLSGTDAEPFADYSAPRPAREGVATRTIVIDAELPMADEAWQTSEGESEGEPLTDDEVREQIRKGVEKLVRDLPR